MDDECYLFKINSKIEWRKTMKHIVVIATGGTIAGIGEKGKTVAYHAGEISVDEILNSIPQVNHLAHIEEIQLMNVDSNEMNEACWIKLANKINEVIMRDDVDGIVVTHGTDTIEETAYFLNLTVHSSKPVVITGAMRPASATSADGPYNLYQAIALASSNASNQGIMVLFSNTIYSGRDIQKVNNYKIDAFDQKSFGCLGYMQDEHVYFFSKTFKKHTIQSLFSNNIPQVLPKVAIAYFYGGADAHILEYLSEKNQGIILVGSGNGNYSKEWMNTMNKCALEKGTIFVRASRVPLGIVFNDHVFDPYEHCIAANTLSAQKARILLSFALTQTTDIRKIKEIFEEY